VRVDLDGVAALLLTHVSARYRAHEAEALVRAKLRPDLSARTQLFMG